jgi:hypothetical protein
MDIIELKEKKEFLGSIRLNRIHVQFQELLKELTKRELPDKIVELINQNIEELNSTSFVDNKLKKLLKQKMTKILALLEKELKIVPKGYYQNFYFILGISLGSGIGTALANAIFNNVSYFPLFLGIGMAIGIALGSRMDKKAFKEGRQLGTIIKY